MISPLQGPPQAPVSTATASATSAEHSSQALSDEEQAELARLRKEDTKVRQHEQAHAAAAGPHKQGSIVYDYERGPDGKQYAVSGHVGIDTSKEATPEETVEKMTTVQRAALAPASPSSQDRAVAAKATAMLAEARQEMAVERDSQVQGEYDADATLRSGEQSGTLFSGVG